MGRPIASSQEMIKRVFTCEKGHSLHLIAETDLNPVNPETGQVGYGRGRGHILVCVVCGTVRPMPVHWFYDDFQLFLRERGTIRELSFGQWLGENGYKQPEKVLEWYKSIGATDEEIAFIEEDYDELKRLYLDEREEQGYAGCFD